MTLAEATETAVTIITEESETVLSRPSWLWIQAALQTVVESGGDPEVVDRATGYAREMVAATFGPTRVAAARFAIETLRGER